MSETPMRDASQRERKRRSWSPIFSVAAGLAIVAIFLAVLVRSDVALGARVAGALCMGAAAALALLGIRMWRADGFDIRVFVCFGIAFGLLAGAFLALDPTFVFKPYTAPWQGEE